jgi:hypothetical protein
VWTIMKTEAAVMMPRRGVNYQDRKSTRMNSSHLGQSRLPA